MKIRELLQIEIWSKETTRKILRRIWKVTKPVALVFGVLVLLLGIIFAVEWYWLTNGERKAGKAALAKVEELEQLEKNSGDGFDAMNRQAKTSTAVAEQSAWTLRDRRTAGLLEFYRWDLESEHESRVREMEGRAILAERHLQWPSNPELEKELRDSQERAFSSIRSMLHKELD
jgi:hypothetical protein